MDLSRATASAICRSSSRLAATVLAIIFSWNLLSCRSRFRGRSGAFSRLQIFVDELIGENEFRIGQTAKRKLDVGIVGPDHHIGTVQPQHHRAETLAAFDGRMELDLGFMAGP